MEANNFSRSTLFSRTAIFRTPPFFSKSTAIKVIPTTDPDRDNDVSEEDTIFMIYYYGILFVISVFNLVGNSMVINTFVHHRSIRLPGNYFILSLAISDLAFGLVYPLYNILHVDDTEILSVLGSWNTCTIVITLTLGLLSVSSFNLVGITIIRFISIKEPLKFHSNITHMKAIVGVLVVWFGMIGLSTAVFLRPSTEDPDFDGICRYELFLSVYHLGFTAAISFIIPIAIMIPLYVYMAKQAWRQARQIADLEKNKGRKYGRKGRLILKREMKMFRMTALLLGYFAFAWIPYIIYEIAFMTCDCNISRYVRATVRLLLHSNSAVNIWIYAFRLKEMRQLLKQDCTNLPCCKIMCPQNSVKEFKNISTDNLFKETTKQLPHNKVKDINDKTNTFVRTISSSVTQQDTVFNEPNGG